MTEKKSMQRFGLCCFWKWTFQALLLKVKRPYGVMSVCVVVVVVIIIVAVIVVADPSLPTATARQLDCMGTHQCFCHSVRMGTNTAIQFWASFNFLAEHGCKRERPHGVMHMPSWLSLSLSWGIAHSDPSHPMGISLSCDSTTWRGWRSAFTLTKRACSSQDPLPWCPDIMIFTPQVSFEFRNHDTPLGINGCHDGNHYRHPPFDECFGLCHRCHDTRDCGGIMILPQHPRFFWTSSVVLVWIGGKQCSFLSYCRRQRKKVLHYTEEARTYVSHKGSPVSKTEVWVRVLFLHPTAILQIAVSSQQDENRKAWPRSRTVTRKEGWKRSCGDGKIVRLLR